MAFNSSKTVSETPQAARLRPPTVSRRTVLKGALTTGGFLLGTGPSIAQARRDLRIGLFGGDFGNISPMLRADIQGGIITRNIFDPPAEADHKSRNIVPFGAEAWKVVDPLTTRIKVPEGMKWKKGYGEVTAEDLVYTWQFHLDSKSFQLGSSLSVLAGVKQVGKYVAEVKTSIPYSAFPGISMGYGGPLAPAKTPQGEGNERER